MRTYIIEEVILEKSANEILLALQNERYPYFLDSGMHNNNLGNYSFVGVNPELVIKSKDDSVWVLDEKDQKTMVGDNPFKVLKEIYEDHHMTYETELPFIGGFVGYLGYDLCHFVENLPRTTVDQVNIPDMYFGLYRGGFVIDHINNKIFVTDINKDDYGKQRIAALLSLVENSEESAESYRTSRKTPASIVSNFEKEPYKKAITNVKNYIRSGDIYQANMTQCFSGKMEGDALSLYQKLRHVNPAPFASYIDFGEGQIASSSPERFIKIKDGKVETRPIKGTRPRGATPEEDHQNREDLRQSEKDQSELLMIVDLERNDLSKVAKVGTVEVTELFSIEEYPTVHHLVATVEAEVKESLSPIDVIESTFPGGSITGAPKIRAMEVIDELEPTARNLYTGSIGYIGFNGVTDLNIVIRTFVCKEGTAYFQAGGGIVWDSVEEDEYQESLDKARALKRALEM